MHPLCQLWLMPTRNSEHGTNASLIFIHLDGTPDINFHFTLTQRRRTSCGEVWQQPYLSYQNLCNFPSNSKACEAQWCGCASPNTRSRGQFPILCAFPPFFILILCILFSSYPEFLLILCVLFFFFFLAIP